MRSERELSHLAEMHAACKDGESCQWRRVLDRLQAVVAVARGGCHTECAKIPYGHFDGCALGAALKDLDAVWSADRTSAK
jgi:hypothetical protein